MAHLQVTSGELWGAVPHNGGAFRCVQAYRGQLRPGDRGVEFTTIIPPTQGTGTPFEARWLYCEPGLTRCSPGLIVNAKGFVVLPIVVTKLVA